MSFVQEQGDNKVVGAQNKFLKRPRNRRSAHEGKWRCTYGTECVCELIARVTLVITNQCYDFVLCSI